MARGDQMVRQWRIIQTLISSKTGKSVLELIDILGFDCHLRTVYRDLDALQYAGFPIYNDNDGKKNIWMLMDSAKQILPIPKNIIGQEKAKTDKDYEPFGPEWEKSLMGFRKKELITLLKGILIEKQKLQENR